MRIQLWHGDCFDRLKEIDEGSLDAVICDPPYGLEFMGKDWDRIGDIGKAQGGFFKGSQAEKGVRGEIKSLPMYKPSGNVKCSNCGRWKVGHIPGDGGGGGLKCQCSNPSFPNVGLMYSQKMEIWHTQWVAEVFRVLQPGGLIKAFGGTRTYHRLVSAMRTKGFHRIHLRAWTYGSGFPKSTNISKSIDRMAGATRKVIGTKKGVGGENLNDIVHGKKVRQTTDQGGKGVGAYGTGARQVSIDIPITEAATEAAKFWKGYGTALKPGWEPIVLGYKPG